MTATTVEILMKCRSCSAGKRCVRSERVSAAACHTSPIGEPVSLSWCGTEMISRPCGRSCSKATPSFTASRASGTTAAEICSTTRYHQSAVDGLGVATTIRPRLLSEGSTSSSEVRLALGARRRASSARSWAITERCAWNLSGSEESGGASGARASLARRAGFQTRRIEARPPPRKCGGR